MASGFEATALHSLGPKGRLGPRGSFSKSLCVLKLIFWALHRSQKCKFSGDSKIPFWSALAPRGNQKVNFQLKFVDSWAPGRPFWREPSSPYPPSRRTIVLRTTPPSTHFRGPWGGGPNNRSCCWLGGWVRNWIIKLDHIIGPEIGRSNFLKWTIQFPIQFSDPIFPGIWPQSGVKKKWITKLDQKLDHRFRSTNWVMKLDRKLDHQIGS